MLESRGVNPNTLKARVRADVTWQQIVRGRFGQQLTSNDKDIFEAEGKTSEQKEVGIEYTLHPITFVVPRNSPPMWWRRARGKRMRCGSASADARAACVSRARCAR